MSAIVNKLPKPIPAGGIDRYNEERELCLSLNNKKKENYDRYLVSKEGRNSVLDYLPIKLDIENVSRCNFRCQMCQVSGWEQGKRAEDMSFESFKNLIDEQYGVIELKIQGMGEPILGRDKYFKMIRYARERHIWVRTVTNASILHKTENLLASPKSLASGLATMQQGTILISELTYARSNGHGQRFLLSNFESRYQK